MPETTIVYLDSPLFRGSLQLKRTPKYLRFTCSGLASCSRNWDALDQPEDEPQDGEHLLAAVLMRRDTVHYDGRDKSGKRFGRWEATATYQLIDHQPPQEVMLDSGRWRQWCEEQERKVEHASSSD